jgi:hypothetical protein
MRSAMLTVVPFAERCLHDPTSLNVNQKCQVMSCLRDCRRTPSGQPGACDRRPPCPAVTAGILNTYSGGYGAVVAHLPCMQGVRGSNPLSSTTGQRLFSNEEAVFSPPLQQKSTAARPASVKPFASAGESRLPPGRAPLSRCPLVRPAPRRRRYASRRLRPASPRTWPGRRA